MSFLCVFFLFFIFRSSSETEQRTETKIGKRMILIRKKLRANFFEIC